MIVIMIRRLKLQKNAGIARGFRHRPRRPMRLTRSVRRFTHAACWTNVGVRAFSSNSLPGRISFFREDANQTLQVYQCFLILRSLLARNSECLAVDRALLFFLVFEC